LPILQEDIPILQEDTTILQEDMTILQQEDMTILQEDLTVLQDMTNFARRHCELYMKQILIFSLKHCTETIFKYVRLHCTAVYDYAYIFLYNKYTRSTKGEFMDVPVRYKCMYKISTFICISKEKMVKAKLRFIWSRLHKSLYKYKGTGIG